MNNLQSIIDNIKISDISCVNKVLFQKGTSYSQRCGRPGSAFAVKRSGLTVYTQNGKKTSSDCSHMVFLPKNSIYSYEVVEPGECYIFEVAFEGEMPFDEITCFPITFNSDCFVHAEKCEQYWTHKKNGYRNKAMSCLFDFLSRTNTYDNKYINSSKYEIIKPSIAYLESNLGDANICTATLAKASNISVPYFRRLFYDIYKTPVAKYIETVRINKACSLLRTDVGSVGYIAELVGYRNIYHFSKVFKKVVGVSPLDYKNSRL